LAIDSPTVAGWLLAIRIRKRRHELGLDTGTVVDRLGVSRAYWSRVENDRALLAESKLRDVLDLLRLDEAERDELMRLWELARSREWFAAYGDLIGGDLGRYFGLEGGASRIRTFHGSLIDGLLQTDDYARALIEAYPGNRPTDYARLREVRARRQEHLLHSADPPEIIAVMSETVLWQRIGGETVLKDQLRHLLALIEGQADHLHLRIHPFDRHTGGALASTPMLTFLAFDTAELPDVAFLEAVLAMIMIEKAADVTMLTSLYEEDLASSLDEAETAQLIARRLQAMG
jgi:transcriptional regulator with XRE-family HTH domain